MFAIFVCTVLGLMLRPLPGGAAVLVGITVTMLTGVLTPAQALAGYSNTAVWLVIAAFLFSRAVINSGLARRLALLFIRMIGHTSLGLGYSLVACDVVMASVIPGNSARIGGILMPIGRTLSGIYQSTPGPTAGLLGTYLMLVLYQGDMLACAMYLTGQVSNPIAAGLALKAFKVSMTWSRWLQVTIVPGLVSLAVIPWFVYKLCPPGIRRTPEAATMARAELVALGPPTLAETKVIAVFVLVCGLWATASLNVMATVTVALLGVVLLMLGTLSWTDIIHEHGMGCVHLFGIVRMGETINDYELTTAFAGSASAAFGGWAWPSLMATIVVTFMRTISSQVTRRTWSRCSSPTMLVAAGAPQLVVFSLAIYVNLSASDPLRHTPGLFSTRPDMCRSDHGGKSALDRRPSRNMGTVGHAWWKFLGLW
jgi:DASS family divalent anion:Na+ symporter